jgi:hypothetical protein
MSIGKHRVGHPSRVSDIHVRLTGAGVICGASSRVMNPISGRADPFDLSLIRPSISWGHRVAKDIGIPSPEKMAPVVLRRLRPVGNATKTSTYRSAMGGGKHRFSAVATPPGRSERLITASWSAPRWRRGAGWPRRLRRRTPVAGIRPSHAAVFSGRLLRCALAFPTAGFSACSCPSGPAPFHASHTISADRLASRARVPAMKPVCWLRTALTALAVASTLLVGTSSWSTPVSGVALLSHTSDVVVAPGQPSRSAQARDGEPAHTTVMAEASARGHSHGHGGPRGNAAWVILAGLIVLYVVVRVVRRRRR